MIFIIKMLFKHTLIHAVNSSVKMIGNGKGEGKKCR